MKQDEIYEFINQIKKDYPKFEVGTDEEYQVWKDILSKSSYDLTKGKYEAHKNNEDFKKYPPKANYFMYEGKTAEAIKYVRPCQYCGVPMYNEPLDIHEDRHRSVNYIAKRSKQIWNKDIAIKELMEMSQEEFDSKYLEFLKKVHSRSVSSKEKRNIENIIYSTENTEANIAPDNYKIIKNLKENDKKCYGN